MEEYYSLKVIEYQEAWANTRHYDSIFRNTLFVILSFSFAAMVLYNDGKPYGIYGCILGLLLSVFGFLVLNKITWHYNRAFEIITDIESQLNANVFQSKDNINYIRLGTVDRKIEKPPLSTKVIKNKTIGRLILVVNACLLLFIIFSHIFLGS